MVNSSLRNSLARRNHKERAQPLHRQRLGLLEKHKDYVHRARDYKSKQDRIRKLREKAAFRNKDEFYWGMIKGKTKDGVAIGDRGNEALNTDLVKVLKTQDLGYVRLQIAADEKKVTKLRQELQVTMPTVKGGAEEEWGAAEELAEVEKLAEMGVVLRPQASSSSRSGKGKGKAASIPDGHVVFVDDREAFESYAVQESQTEAPVEEEAAAEDLGWVVSEQTPPKRSAPPAKDIDSEETAESAREHRIELLTTLSAYLGRIRLLRQAEAKLSTTKAMMGKGASKKVRESAYVEDESRPEDRNGERKRFQGKLFKWKSERKK